MTHIPTLRYAISLLEGKEDCLTATGILRRELMKVEHQKQQEKEAESKRQRYKLKQPFVRLTSTERDKLSDIEKRHYDMLSMISNRLARTDSYTPKELHALFCQAGHKYILQEIADAMEVA
jgi:hypothetical protein